MSEKILPLGEPIIKCFLYDAYPMSILATDTDYLPWFYSNYIQLCCHKNYLVEDSCFYENRLWHYNRYIPQNKDDFQKKNGVFVEFFAPKQALSSPWIKLENMSWSIINKSNIDIIKFIKLHIDDNYYFYGFVDEYYIKDRNAYNKYHFTHDILVYGYDDKNFYTKCYNKIGNYASLELSFIDFYEAFIHNDFSKDKYYWTDDVYFIKKNVQTKYSLNINLISKSLNEYIYSENSAEKFTRYCDPINNMLFGMSIYDGLKEYFELLVAEKEKGDIRIPNLLLEHKNCMKLRIDYIADYFCDKNKYDFYSKQYVEIAKKILLCQNLMIKYSYKKDNNIIRRISNLFNEIREQEYETLCSFVEILNKENVRSNCLKTKNL